MAGKSYVADRPVDPSVDPDAPDPIDDPPLDTPDPRATYLRLQLAEVRRKKGNHIKALAQLDIEEERLADVFSRNFPGEPFRPAVPWTALNYNQQMTAHFISQRGVVKRLRNLALTYVKLTGEAITPDTFAIRISRLHLKGVLVRHGGGWSIAPDYEDDARKQPVPPGRPTGPEAVRLAMKRARRAPSTARRQEMRMAWWKMEEG